MMQWSVPSGLSRRRVFSPRMREVKKPKLVSPQLFQEYLEGVASAQEEEANNIRALAMLQVNAELQYRLNGGARCGLCRSTVRHVIPVTVEGKTGRVDQYSCLCTRCYEGERAMCRRIYMELGGARFEQRPREPKDPRRAKPFRAPLAMSGKKAISG